MKKIFTILMALHVLLIMLSATNFTLVTFFWGAHKYSLNYYAYSFQSGWGYRYISNYSLAQVLVYCAGYLLGIPVFLVALRRGWAMPGLAGLIVCVLGVFSFAFEATHWLWDHNTSWIVSLPGVLGVLWVIWSVRVIRLRAGLATAPHANSAAMPERAGHP